jgi:hypothetical protein
MSSALNSIFKKIERFHNYKGQINGLANLGFSVHWHNRDRVSARGRMGDKPPSGAPAGALNLREFFFLWFLKT